MALRTIVKVGSISNLSDARYCSGMGVQYLGFSLDSDNENYVDPQTLKSIREWVVGPRIVGEFSTSDLDSITNTIERYDIDAIQISDIEVCNTITSIDLPVILALDISTFENPVELREVMAKVNDRVAFFLLYKSKDNTDIQKEDLLVLANDFRIMVGYGIDVSSIGSWIDNTNIYGICLKGSIEIKPGFKDYDELADILEMLEID